jgi:hypothetical protein
MMILAEVGDVVWQALIAGVVTVLIGWMQARTKSAVDESAKQADAQAAATGAKMDGLAKVADATHTLVNSNFGVQLKISALALHRVAELTGHPDDKAAAEIAEKAYQEHLAKQAVVDAAVPSGPAGERESMRSGSTPVLVAIVAVAFLGIAGLIALHYGQTTIDSTLAGQVVIIVGGVLAFLYKAYTDEQSKQEAAVELRRNSAITEATAETVGVNVARVNTESAAAETKRGAGEGGT